MKGKDKKDSGARPLSAVEKQLEDFFDEPFPEITAEVDKGWRIKEIEREIVEYAFKNATTIAELVAKEKKLEKLEAERKKLLSKTWQSSSPAKKEGDSTREGGRPQSPLREAEEYISMESHSIMEIMSVYAPETSN